MNPAIRKPPAPSLEDMVRRFTDDEYRKYALTWSGEECARLLAFVRSIPPINAEAERAEALRAQRDQARALLLDCADLLREHYSDEDVEGDPPQRVPSPALRMETRIRDYLEGR